MRLWPSCQKVGCRKRATESEDGYRFCARHAAEYRELVPPILRRDRQV